MKSFSAFITEKKKPEKPQVVNQADVSKDAANYRRAQRQRNATGGPTTGRTGSKSFPGDRSGAYAKAKADLEARKGFSGSKSGGLKADEANPNVNRAVRQQRSAKQGVSDPWLSSTKASNNPFKGLRTGNKPTAPDPFEGNSSVPKSKPQGPEQKVKPGPAETEARRNVRAAQARLDKTKPGTKSNIRDYVKSQTKGGYKVSPELEDTLLRGRSSDTEVRYGGDTAPPRKPRTSGKPASAAVNTARASGDFRAATTSFKDFSRKATTSQRKLKLDNPALSPAGKSAGVQKQSALARQTGNPMRQGAFDAFMNRVDKVKVKVDEPKGLPSGKKSLPGTAKPPKPPKPPALPGTAKPPKPPKAPKAPKPKNPSSLKLPPARKTPALAAAGKNASNAEKIVNRTLGKIGRGAVKGLGVGATGVDAFLNYRNYRNQGDSKLKSGLKSAFKTSVGWLGGAAGSTLGSFAGPVGTIGGGIAGYSAGTWLADKVLGTTKKNRESKKK